MKKEIRNQSESYAVSYYDKCIVSTEYFFKKIIETKNQATEIFSFNFCEEV
jgi:hypothetical protein